jgi:hypothetical protein
VATSSALALALLLSATGARLDVGVATEGRTRSTDPRAVQGADVLTDVVVSPTAQGQLLFPRGSLTSGYAPRLSWTDLGGGTARPRRLDALHEGRLRFQLDPSPIWSLGLAGSGAVGRTDLLALARAQAGPVLPPTTVPTTQPIPYYRLRAELALRYAPDRRTTWTIALGRGNDGGSTALGRAALPTQQTATARVAVAWNASREDVLGLRLDATGSRFPTSQVIIRHDPAPSETVTTDQRSAFGTGLATWRRQLAPTATLSAGAGAALLYSEALTAGATAADAPRRTPHHRLRPAAEAGLSVGPDRRGFTASADAQLGATIDRLTGVVSQQVQGGLTGSWRPGERLTLTGRAASSLAWYDPSNDTRGGRSRTGSLELRGAYAFTPRARMTLGTYANWQRPQPGAAVPFLEYGVSVGLGLDAPPLVR